MSAVVVKYHVQRKLKKGEKSIPRSIFIIPQDVLQQHGSLKRSLLLDCLPLEGTFHVRAKTLLAEGSTDKFFWQDLTDDSVQVPLIQGMVHLKCLATSPITNNQSQLAVTCSNGWETHAEQIEAVCDNEGPGQDTYLPTSVTAVSKTLQKTLGNLGDRMKAMVSDSGVSIPSAKSINTKVLTRNVTKAKDSVRKGFSSFFSAVKKGIGKVSKSIPQKPSSKASMVVHMLHFDLHSPVDLTDAAQAEVMKGLWSMLSSIDSSVTKTGFRPNSNVWKKLGFEGADPTAQMLECGVLGLKCLGYMLENYDLQFKMMLRSQLQKKKTFPIAAVTIALVVNIASVLELTDYSEFREPGPAVFWRLFEDNAAFFELFALALTLFNHHHARNRVRNMAQAVAEVGGQVRELLDQAPATVKEMRSAAAQLDMLFI